MIERKSILTGKGELASYLQTGEGKRNLLLVHGNLAGAVWWKKILSMLPFSYRAYALDLPGHGETPETHKRHTMEYLCEFLYDFVFSLNSSPKVAKGLLPDNFFLVGHSMGGGVAQLFAIRHPQMVKKLVIVNSMSMEGFHGLYNYGREKLQTIMESKLILEKALTAVLGCTTDSQFTKEILETAMSASKQVFLEQPVTMHEANWSKYIHLLTAPTLCVHGEHDVFVPIEGAIKTSNAIKNCSFRIMKDTNHSPMVEKPEEFSKLIFDFFDDSL